MSVVSQRNHLVDLARVASMVVVIVFHTLLWQILLVDGRVQVVPWAPGPVFWAISWVATIIPIFFVAAGFANAVVVDRWRTTGASYAAFLTLRGSRLLGPMTLFTAVFAAVGTIGAWTVSPTAAATLSREFAQLLWFAVVYLLLLGAAPLAVWLHDRLGGWVMLPLLIGVVAVDAAVRVTGDLGLQWVNLAFVWPLAHQWGIAYHRGWFRTWRPATLLGLLALGAAVIAGLVWLLGYPPAAVAWADVLVANLLPPTLAITVLGLCQTIVLALLQRAQVADRLSERVLGVVRVANALLLSAYLWHIPAIVLGAGILVGLSLLFPPVAVVLMNPLVLIVVVLAIVIVAVPQIARCEVQLIPAHGDGEPRPVTAWLGYALFVIGVWSVWQFGALLHPAEPAAGLALLVFALGVWLFRRATIRTSG